MTDSALSSTLPIRLELTASPGLAATILAVHAAAAGCFLTVLTGWQGFALAGLTLALGSAAAWDRALLRARRSPKVLEIHGSGAAKCLFANGDSAVLQPLKGSAVTRYWVALGLHAGLRAPWGRSLFIAAGMLAPQGFRLLRVWALWGRLPGVPFRQPATGPG